MGWLFGALAEGGVELPESFDIKGIIKLLASIFGLTWRNIRNRLVKQIGEPAMAAVERGVDVFQKLAAGGVGALWEMLVEKLGDIKEMILEQVKDFVVTKIITAGITWLIGLLNPAAAFIKACKLIYDVVMFFVSNAEPHREVRQHRDRLRGRRREGQRRRRCEQDQRRPGPDGSDHHRVPGQRHRPGRNRSEDPRIIESSRSR